MNVNVYKVGQLDTNCIIVEKNNFALIIDPGGDPEFLADILQRNEIIPIAILLTHGHFDHVMGAYALQINYNLPVFVHNNDKFLIENYSKSTKYYLPNIVCDPPPVINNVIKEKKLIIGNFNIEISNVPGHTPGSIAYIFNDLKTVCIGDIFFADGYIGRTDFSYCSKTDLYSSIRKILKLSDDYLLYPGHGEVMNVKKARELFGDFGN